jgi:hypothetical protein
VMREEGDVRIGVRFAQSLERGCGHHGVPEPIDAANEYARSLGLHWSAY